MSSIQDMGVPGTGIGILHPALTYCFRVVLEVGDLDTRILTAQAVRVTDFPIFLPEGAVGAVAVNFQNDAAYRVSRMLMDVAKKESFTLKLQALDGDENVVCDFVLGDTYIDSLTHSQFDYAGGDTKRSRGKIKFKDYAALEGELSLDDIAKMKTLFDSISFEFESDFKPEIEHTTSVTAVFGYKSVA